MYTFSDPPGPVEFEVEQRCSEVVISWAVPNSSCPITGYHIAIGDSTETLGAEQTNYSVTVNESDCGSTFQISMSAISAAGTGNITTMNVPINCTGECCAVPLILIGC